MDDFQNFSLEVDTPKISNRKRRGPKFHPTPKAGGRGCGLIIEMGGFGFG